MSPLHSPQPRAYLRYTFNSRLNRTYANTLAGNILISGILENIDSLPTQPGIFGF